MRVFRSFFKVFSSFRSRGSALNRRKRSKQVALSVLVLLLTVSIVLAIPEKSTKTTDMSIFQSTEKTIKAKSIAFWNKTFGGTNRDDGLCIHQTGDLGYIIVATTDSFSGNWDIWLIKTDKSGNEAWNLTYSGPSSDVARWVIETTDGDYITIGQTYRGAIDQDEIWLIKTNHDGSISWDQTYGGPGYDVGYCVKETSDFGFIITGIKDRYGSSDLWLIKADNSGYHEWNQTFSGANYEERWCIDQTSDDGYIIVGTTSNGVGGSEDVWLLKTNSTGGLEWNKTYGGIEYDAGYYVEPTSDGGYIIVGRTDSFGDGYSNVWLIKTDANGNEVWNQTYGETGSENEGWCVDQTSDSGFIITGDVEYNFGDSDVMLMKTDMNGNKEWNRTYGKTGYDDNGRFVEQTSDQGYIIVGYTKSYGAGNTDVWLIRPDIDPIIDHPADIIYEIGTTGNTIIWNPSDENPSSYEVTREGLPVESGSWNGSSISVNIDGLPIGNYTYKCTVYDTSGQNASDIVKVTVTEAVEEEEGEEEGFPWLWTGIGAVALIAVIIAVIVIQKRIRVK